MAEKMVERVMRITQNATQIRNICTSAHIHHGKCVSPGTRLILDNGEVISAQDLFIRAEQYGIKVREEEGELVYDISKGKTSVFSLNKETGRLEHKKISHAWKLSGGNCIKVRLRNGAGATTTPEHKYIVLEEMDFVEKEAAELKIGDRIVCARELKTKLNDGNKTIKKRILQKLGQNWYALLSPVFGKQLKERILNENLEEVYSKLQLEISKKSFYHGIWQNRYSIKALVRLQEQFNLPLEEVYDQIELISFRKSAKSTLSICLPHNFTNFFYLAGLFFGDGSGHKFVVGKKELEQKVVALCLELGISAAVRQQVNRVPEVHTNKCLQALLNALFEYPWQQKSHNIKLNNFIFEAPQENAAAFLRGYFDCDGTVENSRRAVSITSVSAQMLKDVQLLLLRFGCVSIVQKDTLYISGLSAQKFVEKIQFGIQEKQLKASSLAGKVQGSLVLDTVPLSRKELVKVRKVPSASIDHHYYKYEQGILTPTISTLQSLMTQFAQQQEEVSIFDKLMTGELTFIEATVLERCFEPIVYDFSVPEHKNFIAEGMVIHNTAFTDNLLAASGQMASKYAGDLEKGMETWQHSDEQERLMTVDAANVSMIHEFEGKEYLINLIDTPGHVDFGGNVTRAMRAVDGTVVLICAVEGVMPQTETVVRQALRERVKPVLFINKMDRLVKELKLSPEKIAERVMALVKQFNEMVERIAEAEYKEKWNVKVQEGSVAFGSARENWALSFPYMNKKGIKFADILKIYEMDEAERKDWVWKNAPLHEVILDMIIKHHPNPIDAQKYRIPKIWHGELDSQFGQDLISCNPAGKLGFVITRIVIDPRSGKDISAGRLFSGTMRSGMEVYLNNSKQRQRVQNVYIYNGIKPEIIESLPAGNVLAISGVLGNAGETVTIEPEQAFEELKHIFEPVITKAIEPKRSGDLPKLVEVLRKVSREDPSIKIEINEETGQNLMSGMGELHLEIIENRIITEKGVEVKTSSPIVVYREAITKKSPEMEGKSPNKHNKLYFVVEPLETEIVKGINESKLPSGRFRKKDDQLISFLREECGWDTKTATQVKAIFNNNMFLDQTRGQVHIGEIIELVLDMFEEVMKQGPLAREPCVGIKVSLTDCTLHEDAIHRGPAQMYPAVREGIRGAMMQAGPVLFEPLQVTRIEAPHEYVGDVSKLVSSKRGQLLDMQQEGDQTVIIAKLPVAEMIGWSSDLRSATGGRGVSSLVDQSFERLPYELQDKVRNSIVQRKGLTEGQLGA